MVPPIWGSYLDVVADGVVQLIWRTVRSIACLLVHLRTTRRNRAPVILSGYDTPAAGICHLRVCFRRELERYERGVILIVRGGSD